MSTCTSIPASIPVTLIGGYLGSGKTTLVNHLLRHADGKRLAIMVNEFGDLPIDEELIEAQSDRLVSLSGGCVCCSYGSDLIGAMNDLASLQPAPDNVVFEASGVAIPGSIAGTVSLMSNFSVDGIVVMADAETVRQRADDRYMGDTIRRQLTDADIIILNKSDLVSQHLLAFTREWLQQTRPGVAILETCNSIVPPEVVLANMERTHQQNQPVKRHHPIELESRKITPDDRVNAIKFARDLLRDNSSLIRAKGFVKDFDGSMKTIQIVGQRIEITTAPAGVASGLVVISQT